MLKIIANETKWFQYREKQIQKRSWLAIENHGKCGNVPEFLRGIKKKVNDDRIALTLDSGNFYWYGFLIG